MMQQLAKDTRLAFLPISTSLQERLPKPGQDEDLEQLLPEILANAVALIGADSASLWRMDADGSLRIAFAHNLPSHLLDARCLSERWTALAPGGDQEPLWLPAPGEAALASSTYTYTGNGHNGSGWAICTPLACGGKLLGLLNLNLPGSLGPEAEPCSYLSLRALARQAATVLYCLQLQRTLKEREGQVTALRKAAIEAREEERQRLRIEVHDRVARSLAPALYYLQAYQQTTAQHSEEARKLVAKAQRFVQEAMQEARQVITDLRPPALEALGLAAALRLDVEEMKEQTGWQVELDLADLRLPRDVDLTLYRIAHEALANVRKHAQTERVVVRLFPTKTGAVLEVQDFGVGFEPYLQPRDGCGQNVGLSSMRKRAELLQGRCEVISAPGAGTLVRVTIPGLEEGRDGADKSDARGRPRRSPGGAAGHVANGWRHPGGG